MNWRRVFGVIEKYIYESQRDIFRVFDVVWWPVFQLFIWGLFSVYLQKVSPNTPNIVSILLGAVMLWSFFERASKDVTIIVVVEMWNRNLINIFATPLKISEYLMGIMVVAIAKLVVSALLLVFLATVLYAFRIGSIGWYVIPATVGLTIFGWSISFIIQACLLRFGQSVEVFIWAAATVVQPFSCVFYPISALPPWGRPIAMALPSTYLFENMRRVMNGQPIDMAGIGISFGLNALYFVIALWIFYRSFAQAKVRGSLVKQY